MSKNEKIILSVATIVVVGTLVVTNYRVWKSNEAINLAYQAIKDTEAILDEFLVAD